MVGRFKVSGLSMEAVLDEEYLTTKAITPFADQQVQSHANALAPGNGVIERFRD